MVDGDHFNRDTPMYWEGETYAFIDPRVMSSEMNRRPLGCFLGRVSIVCL